MKFADHLSEDVIRKLSSITKSIEKKPPDSRMKGKKIVSEKLSRKEWEEIMGKNRDIYKRVKGGAIRRK